MRSRIHRYLALAALLMLMCGCIKDFSGSGAPGESTITLRLSVPGGGNGGTRSIAAEPDAAGENKIGDIAVLALTEKGSDWVFDYQAKIVSEVRNGAELVITAKVRDMSSAQQFVILANAAAELAAADPVRYENIAAIENRLICTTGNGEWPANNNDDGNFTPFPMYARTKAHVVNTSNNLITNEGGAAYQLIRMVARIDVTLKDEIPPSEFKLTEACLFNYRTKGYVSYANSGFDGTKATTPAVPANSANTSDTPIRTVLYNADASGKILSSIYTFESPAITSDADKTTGTALVVGGYYDGSGTKSYYRIDFKTGDNISDGLLRNHQYKVEIRSVTGGGYGDPLEAYRGSIQLSATVKKWDEADQNVIADGQYFLYVAADELLFTDAEGSAEITAETDYDLTENEQGYPKGIQVSQEGTAWITNLTAETGDSKNYKIKFKVAEFGNDPVRTAPSRTAKIKVTAGNMTKVINVTQVLWGGRADILYFDPDDDHRLKIGRWDSEITKDNYQKRMVFTKFGSVIGFTIEETIWDNQYIKFNPSTYTVGEQITNYALIPYDPTASNALPHIPGFVKGDYVTDYGPNISSPGYHKYENIKGGKGDICQLLGLTAKEIQDATTKEAFDALLIKRSDAYKGWRLPTARENTSFVGGASNYSTWIRWENGGSGFSYWPVTDATNPNNTMWPFYYNNSGNLTAGVEGLTAGDSGDPATGRFPVVTDIYNDAYTQVLPAVGYRDNNSKVTDDGTQGFYWSSTPISSNEAYRLYFYYSGVLQVSSGSYSNGYSVRCVRPVNNHLKY